MSGAIELIHFDDESKTFKVNDDAVKVLRNLKGPVSVVVVCGRARQGKSFLLNKLQDRLSKGTNNKASFAVASTHRPCTKGLWMWSQPSAKKLPNGKPYHLVLIDCEGIDAFDQTLDYSTQIFSLGVLLSSVLIYNQMGGIDESSIDKLANVCEFAKLIRSKAGGSGAPGSGGAELDANVQMSKELSPSFIWLLRDFHFQLDVDGRKLTTGDYMEETLQEMSGMSNSARNKNMMRQSIKSIFPDRTCHALVRPVLEESKLINMDCMPYSNLRPEFREGLELLLDGVLLKAVPKTCRGQMLTGGALAALASAFVDVINSGQTPLIANTWMSVVHGECRRAQEAAIAAYHHTLNAVSGSGEAAGSLEQLELAHAAALKAAMELFDEQSLGESVDKEPFRRQLEDAVAAAYAAARGTRLAQANERIAALLGEGSASLEKSLRGEGDAPPDLAAASGSLRAFLQRYEAATQGPSKYARCCDWLAQTAAPAIFETAARLQAAAAEWRQKAVELQKRLETSESEVAELRRNLAASESASAQLRTQLEAQRAVHEGLRAQLDERGEQIKAAQAQLEHSRVSLEELRKHGQAVQRKAEQDRERLQSELQALGSRALAAEALLQERTRQGESTQAQLEHTRTSLEELRTQAQAARQKAEQDRERLQSELHAASSRALVLEAQLGEKASRAEGLQAQLEQTQASLKELREQGLAAQQKAEQERERSIDELRKLSTKAAAQETAINDKDGRANSLKAELEQTQAMLEELRKHGLAAQQKAEQERERSIDELRKLSAKAAAQETAIIEKDGRSNSLKAELEQMKAMLEELRKQGLAVQQKAELDRESSAGQQEALRMQLAGEQRHAAKLAADLAAAEQRAAVLEANLKSQRSSASEQGAALNTARAEVATLQQMHQDAAERADAAEVDVVGLQALLKQTHESLDELRHIRGQEQAVQRKAEQDRERQAKDLEAQNELLSKVAEERAAGLEALRKEMDEMRRQAAAREVNAIAAEQERRSQAHLSEERLFREMKEAERRFAEQTAVRDVLEGHLRGAEARLAALEGELAQQRRDNTEQVARKQQLEQELVAGRGEVVTARGEAAAAREEAAAVKELEAKRAAAAQQVASTSAGPRKRARIHQDSDFDAMEEDALAGGAEVEGPAVTPSKGGAADRAAATSCRFAGLSEGRIRKRVTGSKAAADSATPLRGVKGRDALDRAAGSMRGGGVLSSADDFNEDSASFQDVTDDGAFASPANSALMGSDLVKTEIGQEAGSTPAMPDDLDKMTVQQIKNWMTTHGFEEEVFRLNQRKVSKQDFIKKVKQLCS